MKRFFAVLLVVILILAVLLTFAAFQANSLIASIKPQLTKKVSEALGAKIAVEEIGVGFFPTSRLVMSGISIKSAKDQEDAAYPLEVEEVGLYLSLISLLQGEVAITSFSVEAPNATLLKTSEGFRVAGLPAPQKALRDEALANTALEKRKERRKEPKSSFPLRLELKNFSVSNGEIAVIEVEEEVAKPLATVRALEVTTALSLADNVASLQNLTISSRVASPKLRRSVPLRLEAPTASVDLGNAVLSLPSLLAQVGGAPLELKATLAYATPSGTITVRSSSLPLSLLSFITSVDGEDGGLMVGGSVAPELTVQLKEKAPAGLRGNIALKQIEASQKTVEVTQGTGSLKVDGTTENLVLTSQDLSFLLGEEKVELPLSATVAPTEVFTSIESGTLFGGSVKEKVRLSLTGEKSYTSQSSLAGVSLGRAAAALKLPHASFINGTLASFDANLRGDLEGNLLEQMEGPLSLEVVDGLIKDLNIFAAVVDSLSSMPIVGEKIQERLPPELQSYLSSSDTSIRSLVAEATLSGGVASIKSLLLESDAFSLKGNGEYGLISGDLDLATTFLFSPEVTEAFVTKVKELRRARDSSGRLSIPIVLKGTVPKIIVVPDVEELAKNAVVEEVKERAKDKVKKFLKKEGLFGF